MEWRDIETLIPYSRNARKHSAAQIRQLSCSIERFGFTMPVLVDESGGIIAGHGRTIAAKALGWNRVPVMVARGWSGEKKRAYVVADNKLASNSEWDRDLLADELDAIRDCGEFELETLGFARFEINDLIGTPDTPEDAGNTKPGDARFVTCPRCVHEFEVK
jgi:ParB-like chromosome segregation protein Spo0J